MRTLYNPWVPRGYHGAWVPLWVPNQREWPMFTGLEASVSGLFHWLGVRN